MLSGEPKGQVEGNRHKSIENSNEVSFSHDGSRFVMVAEPENLRVHSWNGTNYNDVLLDYTHKGVSNHFLRNLPPSFGFALVF